MRLKNLTTGSWDGNPMLSEPRVAAQTDTYPSLYPHPRPQVTAEPAPPPELWTRSSLKWEKTQPGATSFPFTRTQPGGQWGWGHTDLSPEHLQVPSHSGPKTCSLKNASHLLLHLRQKPGRNRRRISGGSQLSLCLPP